MAKNDSPNRGPSAGTEPSLKCKFTECSKRPKKFGFCEEHYEWYMAGVIRGDGTKPSDYEQKMSGYLKKKKVA